MASNSGHHIQIGRHEHDITISPPASLINQFVYNFKSRSSYFYFYKQNSLPFSRYDHCIFTIISHLIPLCIYAVCWWWLFISHISNLLSYYNSFMQEAIPNDKTNILVFLYLFILFIHLLDNRKRLQNKYRRWFVS